MNQLHLAQHHFRIAQLCFRLGLALMVLAVLLLAGPAFAQEAAPSSASTLGLQLLGQLLPMLVGIIGLVLTGLVVLPLQKWLAAKAQTSALAGVAMKAEHLAEGVVADLNATLVPELQSALKDGVITKEEAAHLREVAMGRLKSQLGTRGLTELSGVLGIGGAALEQYIGGLIEKKVEAAKGAGELSALAVQGGAAAVMEINKGGA